MSYTPNFVSMDWLGRSFFVNYFLNKLYEFSVCAMFTVFLDLHPDSKTTYLTEFFSSC